MISLEMKIGFVLAKARNLVYYASIDSRPRVTYIHIVRELRKDLKKVLSEFPVPENKEYKILHSMFLEIIRSINSKIKSSECKSYILETLAPILDRYEKY